MDGDVVGCPGEEQCVPYWAPWDVAVWLCSPVCDPLVDGTNGANPDDVCPPFTRCVPPEADPTGNATGPYCALGVVGRELGGGVGDRCSAPDQCSSALPYPVCAGGFCSSLYCSAESLPEGLQGCPDGSVCRMIDPDGSGALNREQSTDASLGFCLLDCSMDESICPAGMTCNTGGCLPETM